jgi:hypothetical protein
MDTIEFDINGFLVNGEHRLRALSTSNAVVLLNVAYGRNPANYYKHDYNYGRTGGNLVSNWAYDESEAQIKLPKADGDSVSAAASLCIYYWAVVPLEHRLKITPTNRIKFITQNPQILPNLKTIRNYVDAAGITKKSEMPCAESILLALLTLGSDVNQAKAREFIKGVIMGEGELWYAGSPVQVYRKELDAGRHNAKGKGRVYNSYKYGMGLFALRQYLDGNDIEKTAKGYILRYKPGKEKSIARLSEEHEKSVAWMREQMREEKKNRLLVLLNPITPEITPISVLADGKFFGKTTMKGLTKLGIVTIADILAFSEVGLRMVLKSAAIDEVKTVLGALDLTLSKR